MKNNSDERIVADAASEEDIGTRSRVKIHTSRCFLKKA
jgi:hypothetical protein